MLFKISTEKMDRNVPENNLTFVKTHILSEENSVKQRGGKLSAVKWTRRFLNFIGFMTFLLGCLAIFYIICLKHPFNDSLISSSVDDRVCTHKHRSGSCIAHNHCCDGEYLIGNNICPSTGFCCLGTIRECTKNRSENKSDFWSFPSLTQISSKIIYRNVSETIVELAIVSSVSALEQIEYFNEISSKIENDMSSTTGQKWFCVIGNKDSFDLNLNQFSAFILITVNELEIVLFKMAQNIPSNQSSDYSSYELNDHNIEMENDLKLTDHDYGLDARPTIEILRNEMNESVKEFAIQTIDYVLNSCINSYSCVTFKLIRALNQQFGNKGNEWQCIITSNTVVYQMVADIQHLRGFLLDFIYNNRHRILIYKTDVKAKTSEIEVIKSGRKALAFNKTIIIENYINFKANDSILTEPQIIEDIRRAVIANNKFQTVCQDLTSMSNKYSKSWGCFAGPHHSFGYYMSKDPTKPYLIIKLNQLMVILFQKTCYKRYKI